MPDATNSSLPHLTQQFRQAGQLEAIYLRQARGIDCIAVEQTEAIAQKGLAGDRASNTPSRNPLGSNRQVTLIQAEHIAVISALIGTPVDATKLRRNLVVSGINLLATKSLFKDQIMQIKIGEVILQVTGPCEPCSKMETTLGQGGYNAMRGHGGINAKIIQGGTLNIGDSVTCEPMQNEA
jgi:MOSC domain-containing protein YiiM